MQDDFCVGVCAEAPAAADQVLAQLDVIEDFAVERDMQCAVVVRHRLLTGREVDDAQARVAKPDAAIEVNALPVRSAMRDGSDHALQQRAIHRDDRLLTMKANNPTHAV
jgi:hypothetical protein